MATKTKQLYRVLCWGACGGNPRTPCGIDYPPNKRAETGDIVSDLPTLCIEELVEAGVIEPVGSERRPDERDDIAEGGEQ